jgi:hypothetical protein
MRPFAGGVQFFFWTRRGDARHFTTSEGDCTARTRCEGRCRLPSETRAASPLRPKSANSAIRAQPVNPRSRNCHSSAAYDWHISAGWNTRYVAVNSCTAPGLSSVSVRSSNTAIMRRAPEYLLQSCALSLWTVLQLLPCLKGPRSCGVVRV